MKFVSIFVALVAFCLFVGTISVPNSISAHNTSFQDTDGGKIFYLDRHTALCSSGAMTYFTLERKNRDSDYVRWANTCVISDAITGSTTTKETPFNKTNTAWWGANKSINYLDRHNVMCADDSVLKSFKIDRNPNKKSEIRYVYKCVAANYVCCKSHTTAAQDEGSRSVVYLDRQKVGKINSKKYAMKGFKANSANNKMSYTYEMCKLTDMDAIKAVEQAKKNLEDIKDQYQAAMAVVAQATGKYEELKKKETNSFLSLERSIEHVKSTSTC